MRNLVDSALPHNSISQNWGTNIKAYCGRIGSGYIGPCIMGDDIALRMYQQISGTAHNRTDPREIGDKTFREEKRYVSVSAIEHHTELRNNSTDMAHVEVSFWKLRGGRNAVSEYARVTADDNLHHINTAPKDNNVLDWLRWELQGRQDNSLNQTAGGSDVSYTQPMLHSDENDPGYNLPDTISASRGPRLTDSNSAYTGGRTVPIMDQLGTSLFSGPHTNKVFKCIKMMRKTLGMGQVWPISYKGKSRFNTSHIMGSLHFFGQQPSSEEVNLRNTNTPFAIPGQVYMVCRVWGVPAMTSVSGGQGFPGGNHWDFPSNVSTATTTEAIVSCVTTQKYFFQERVYNNQEEFHSHTNFVDWNAGPNHLTDKIIMAQIPYLAPPAFAGRGQYQARDLFANPTFPQVPYTVPDFVDPTTTAPYVGLTNLPGYSGDSYSSYVALP